ncbi:MAG TPA: hypothetical protein VJ644_04865, partial [Jiangellaceae bacterium]|nr:hypothetical protein [Jiangellaceae bacterium]
MHHQRVVVAGVFPVGVLRRTRPGHDMPRGAVRVHIGVEIQAGAADTSGGFVARCDGDTAVPPSVLGASLPVSCSRPQYV